MDVAVTVDVHDDGSGLVTVEVAVDDAVLAAEPDLLDELRLDDLVAAGWDVEAPTQRDDGMTAIRLRKPFADAAAATGVLAEVSGPGGPLGPATVTVARAGDRVSWRFDGSASLAGLEAFSDAELDARVGGDPLGDRLASSGTTLLDALGLTVTVRLPATVTDASALPLRGRSVTWYPALAPGASTQLRAEAVVVDAGDARPWRAGAIGAGSALGVVVLVETRWLWRRHRRRAQARAAEASAAG